MIILTGGDPARHTLEQSCPTLSSFTRDPPTPARFGGSQLFSLGVEWEEAPGIEPGSAPPDEVGRPHAWLEVGSPGRRLQHQHPGWFPLGSFSRGSRGRSLTVAQPIPRSSAPLVGGHGVLEPRRDVAALRRPSAVLASQLCLPQLDRQSVTSACVHLLLPQRHVETMSPPNCRLILPDVSSWSQPGSNRRHRACKARALPS